MVASIANWEVEQYTRNVVLLAEQRMSRLRGTVQSDTVKGVAWDAETIGGTTVQEIVDRHGDTPLNDISHNRRWGYVRDYDTALLIDQRDRLKILVQPDNIYAMRQASVMGRAMDSVIIQALGGLANAGRTGSTTTVALPPSQQITAGGVGMTVDKLLEAKEKLDAAEVDPANPRYLVMAARQFRNLLRNTQVTSADFNSVRALVNGEINSFLGFNFIRSELLPVDGSGDRLCYAYTSQAISFGVAQAPETQVNVRPDKRNATQIYTWGSWGAVRLEEVQVVEIACDE